MDTAKFKPGDRVEKTTGDYTFSGIVVCRFHKLHPPDALRYVVENDAGIVHIFNEKQLNLHHEYTPTGN